jgi:hypothetical protein
MDPALRQTLLTVAALMRDAHDEWWIIASAAMTLHGAAPIEVADVDLLLSERDGHALLGALGLSFAPPIGTDRFRSALFARWGGAPVPVEIMAGFHVRSGDDWRPVVPTTRIAIRLDDVTLFVPSIEELIAHCRLYGRPKDARRAAILQRLRP